MVLSILLLIALPPRDECWRQANLWGLERGRWERRVDALPDGWLRRQFEGWSRSAHDTCTRWMDVWEAADTGKSVEARLTWMERAESIPPSLPEAT